MSTNLEAEVTRNRSWFARRRVWYVLSVLFVLFLVFLYFCLVPSRLIISPETTLITKLKPDGKPDYIGAILLEQYEQLTTPDDNGLRIVVEKFGPYVIDQHSHGILHDTKGYAWEDLPKDSTDIGEWYRTIWVPFCNAMSIDPTKRPLEYKPITEKLNEAGNAKYKKTEFQFELTTKLWRAEDYPDIAKFVEEAAEALAVYSFAAKKPQWAGCWQPSVDENHVGISYCWSTFGICSDFAIRANERISRNDIAGAFDDALNILRIGRHVQNSLLLFERSYGIRAEMTGINVIQSILTHGNPNAEQIRRFVNESEELTKPVNISDKTLLCEKMIMLYTLYNSDEDNLRLCMVGNLLTFQERCMATLLTTLPIDYNVASKRLQAHFKRIEELSKENDVKKRIQLYFKFDADMKRLRAVVENLPERLIRTPLILHRSTLIADCIFYHVFSGYFRDGSFLSSFALEFAGDSLLFTEFRLAVQRDLLRVSLALELYQRENGHYPDKLESIAPKYIDVIPEDPFTSKELTYKKIDNGYILYSFGQNKIDDGGDNTKDITVERTRNLNE